MLVKDFIKNFNQDCRIRVAVFDKNILADSLYINIDDIKAPITNYEIKSVSVNHRFVLKVKPIGKFNIRKIFPPHDITFDEFLKLYDRKSNAIFSLKIKYKDGSSNYLFTTDIDNIECQYKDFKISYIDYDFMANQIDMDFYEGTRE